MKALIISILITVSYSIQARPIFECIDEVATIYEQGSKEYIYYKNLSSVVKQELGNKVGIDDQNVADLKISISNNDKRAVKKILSKVKKFLPMAKHFAFAAIEVSLLSVSIIFSSEQLVHDEVYVLNNPHQYDDEVKHQSAVRMLNSTDTYAFKNWIKQDPIRSKRILSYLTL